MEVKDPTGQTWRVTRRWVPWRRRLLVQETEATKVLGIEARGFLLGPAVAQIAPLGFVAVRKGDGLFAGATDSVLSERDYRGIQQRLRLRAADLSAEDVVVLVDD